MAVFPGGYNEKEDIVDDDVILFSDSENDSAIIYVSMASLINKIFADGLLTIDEANSRIGIGTPAPSTTLDVNGSFTAGASITITTGTYNDIDVSGIKTIYCNTVSGDITINGISNGVTDQEITIIKTSGSNNLILSHFGGGTQPIVTQSGANVTYSSRGRIDGTVVSNALFTNAV